jgi:membrane protein DedA with SNARE-associated domain
MFDWIAETVAALGYVGVAALTFLENVFPPIPSELVIPLAGYVAATGSLHLAGVIAAATVGSLAGAVVWYEVGRRVGERRLRTWVEHHGKWLTLSTADLDRADAWLRRHGRAAVFIGRLVPGVRTFVSLPAGFAGMPFLSFLLYSAAGTAIWTVALAYAGVLLQSNFTAIGDYMDPVTYAVLGLLAVMMGRRYVQCWMGGRRGDSPAQARR